MFRKIPRKYRIIFFVASILLLIINGIVASHAWHFTHFSEKADNKTELSEMVFGPTLIRPENPPIDTDFFEIDTIRGARMLEVWRLDMEPSRGIVLLFHGYRSSKASLLREAKHFYRLGYSAVLIDFRGSGGSEGNITTIGYYEAEDVEAAAEWVKFHYPEQPVILYGVSMGAVAIMRAVAELDVSPDKIILQSPYKSLRTAVASRLKRSGIPAWPFSDMLTFWGGMLHGFNAFDLSATDYAENIAVPVLLIHGKLDDRVSWDDTESIYESLRGEKELVQFEHTGHESVLNNDEDAWVFAVEEFINGHKNDF